MRLNKDDLELEEPGTGVVPFWAQDLKICSRMSKAVGELRNGACVPARLQLRCPVVADDFNE
jgi:hypothetical protein